MSLQVRIFLRVMALVGLLIAAICAVYAVSAVRHHRESTKEYLQVQAHACCDEIDRLVLWDDRVGLKRTLDLLSSKSIHGAEYAFVAADGRPYVHTFADGVPRMLLERQVPADPSVWTFKDNDGSVLYDVTARVAGTGVVLHVGVSRAAIDRELRPLFVRIAFLAAIAAVVGAILSLLFTRWTTREVDQLTGELKGSRDFLQTVIDGIPDPMMVIDRNYRVALANRRVQEVAGEEKPVANRLSCFEVSHDRDNPCDGIDEPCPLKQVIATKAPMRVIHTHRDAERGEVVYEVSAAPICDDSGEVVQVIESCRDITERVRAETALRTSEKRYRSVVEIANNVIICLGPGFHILEWNKAAERLFGWERGEVLGKYYLDWYIAPEFQDTVAAEMKKVFAGEPTENLEYPVRTRNGPRKTLLWNVTRLLGIDDEPMAIVAFGRDITDQKSAEQETAAKMKEIADSNRMAAGQELKIDELKEEVDELLRNSDRPPKYKAVK